MPRGKCLLAAVLTALIILTGFPTGALSEDAAVKMREEEQVIPTYKVGPPDPDPMFYNGRAYQGAKGPVYPYPSRDNLTNQRENQAYKTVFLENKYIQISVIPELGGRIFSALDKTDAYDFFYRQHVIKPALIGCLGAWISGGVEWNVPHHHRASTFVPVDYTMQENPDGSKTVWVGEIELRHRMKWLVGLTVFPDKSYIENTVRIYNRTPLVHTFLYWANVAVHADSSYQVIFPPSLEYATYHGKDEFTTWPIAHQYYRGVDFTSGVDLSWWKNLPSPVSLFAFDCTENFFAGYDHGKKAGVLHVADHHLVPGKKLWQWGPGTAAQMWDKILTDTDGPYIELMVGAFSDNQPDYSWAQPYEVKTFKQYWYPIRDLEGVKNATLEAACNLEVTGANVARLGFNTSAEYNQARVLFEARGKVLFEQEIDISPRKPFLKEVRLPAGVKEEDLKLSLFSAEKKELVSYQPVKKKGSPMPETVVPPPPPAEIKTIEELYLAGQRLDQFYNPALEPDPYYEEALRRDPGDYRVNTALGILYLKREMFKEAEEKFNTAVERATSNHTKPRDGEAYYYLGVACKAQGKDDSAYDAFYKATWSNAWHAAGFYSLAELAAKKGDFPKALEFLDRSIATNSFNTKALNLKAAVLRRLEHDEEAKKMVALVLSQDPLDFWAGNELYLADSASGLKSEAQNELDALEVKMRGQMESYLELAVSYGDCGLWDEAIGVLERFVSLKDRQTASQAMVLYYLGYYYEKKGNGEEASRYYQMAGKCSPDYVFPYRFESIDVLSRALRKNPGDSRAHYYLGNLLFDSQPEKAIEEWEKSRDLDGTFPIVHRNLGLAYARVRKNIPEAISALETAVSLNKEDPRFYLELDQLYERGGESPQKRLTLLEKNHETVSRRDDALAREIVLYIQLGQYDRAIELLEGHHFNVWEGGGEIHNVFVDAHLFRGQKYFREKKYQQARQDFEAALQYPRNLEVGKPYRDRRSSEVNYFIGTVYEALGQKGKARSFYEESAAGRHRPSEIEFYQGMAFRKLDQEKEADKVFESLIDFGKRQLGSSSTGVDFFSKFGEKLTPEELLAEGHYLIGLGYLGKDDNQQARLEFEKAVGLNRNHIHAAQKLAAM
ncbi:MAG TPA: DUF5107 domain-containing protein [archaeon]|nr:DUF5107 domain-containing protein [archaeon]